MAPLQPWELPAGNDLMCLKETILDSSVEERTEGERTVETGWCEDGA